MIDWLQGEKFKTLVDYLYSPKVKKEGDYDNLINTLDIDKLKDYDIIYTHTMYANQLFDEIECIDKKLVIITHNSDISVDNSFRLPDNVIKWYSTNVNILDSRIESIPIGIENDMWHKEVNKKQIIENKLKTPRYYRNLVYINHNIATNPAKRTKPYEIFKDKSWVTVYMGSNWHNFEEYIDNIYNHKFVICPEGNGIDTHRIWETLYLGTIPIVENNINNTFFLNLPICMIENWEEITEDFLNKEWEEINDIKKWFEGDKKILTFEYWKNKILNNVEQKGDL